MNAHARFNNLINDLSVAASYAHDPDMTRGAVQKLIPIFEQTLSWLRDVALAQERRPCRRFLVIDPATGRTLDFDTEVEADSAADNYFPRAQVIDTREFA
jgi:hypothetical protein